MISKDSVTITTAGVPGATAIIAAVDAFLAAPWGVDEVERSHTVVWATYGGITVAKARALGSILACYRDFGGWSVEIRSTDDVSWLVVFRRRE